jgi:hypothetical protein
MDVISVRIHKLRVRQEQFRSRYSGRLKVLLLGCVLVLFDPVAATAQTGVAKVCNLLTKEELAAVGVAIKQLLPDDSVSLKKGQIPGLTLDVRMEQCTSPTTAATVIFPVRWSVVSVQQPMDKQAWKKLAEAIGADDEKKTPDPEAKDFSIGTAECATYSWIQSKGAKRISLLQCADVKERQQASVEFAHTDRSKLPSPQQVKQLLDKLLSRL